MPKIGTSADIEEPSVDSASRHIRWLLVLLLAYITYANIDRARYRHFWYDEVFTVTIARLPSMGAVLDALGDGGDGTPPGFFLVERALSPRAANERIGYRLVSIASLPLTSFCLYVFVRRRTSSVSALIAALLPLLTVLYRGYEPGTPSHETLAYGIEARPYAAIVFCLALALVAWQRLPRLWWLTIFSLSLGAAISLHYYAALALIPFGFAEACYVAFARTWRWRVWLALALVAIPLVAFWPLLQHLRGYYEGSRAGTALLHDAISSYDQFLSIRVVGLTMGLVLALSVVLFASVRATSHGSTRDLSGSSDDPDQGLDSPEYVVVLGFLWLPWLGFVVAVIARGGLAGRYTIGAILGMAIAFGYVSHWLGRRAARWLLLCLLAAFASREAVSWRAELAGRNLPLASLAALDAFLQVADRPQLPIVVIDALDFVQLTYYSRPEVATRLTFWLHPSAGFQHDGWDTFDLNLAALGKRLRSRVSSYEAFSQTEDTYLLFVSPGVLGGSWPERLIGEGRSVHVLAAVPGRALYVVTRGAG